MASTPASTPSTGRGSWSVGHTGVNAPDITITQGTASEVAAFFATLTPRRRAHGELLAQIFESTTGVTGVLWGPSMVGYGEAHYHYATGREGDTFRVGFAPRKAKLSLYGLQDTPRWEELSARLGKFTTGASSVYVTKPEDVDLEALAELIADAWAAGVAGEK